MAYSLNGENVHYGTPINPKAPDRIPGGIRTIDLKEVASAKLAHEHLVRHIDELRPDDALLALPTADGIAPRLETPPVELEAFRGRVPSRCCRWPGSSGCRR